MNLTPRQLAKYEKKDFRVRKEDWSKYESKDGKIEVWARVVVTKLFHIPAKDVNAPHDAWLTGSTNVVTAFFPHSMQKTPTGPVNLQAVSGDATQMDFEPLHEPWNEYIIPGSPPKLLKTKLVVTGIRYFKDHVNPHCDPIVQIDSQVVVSDATELTDPVQV